MNFTLAQKRGIPPENRALYENIFKLIDVDGGGGK